MVRQFFASLFAICSLILWGIEILGYLFFTWKDVFSLQTEANLLLVGLFFDTLILGIPLALVSTILYYPHRAAFWALKLHLILFCASPVFAAGYLVFNQ